MTIEKLNYIFQKIYRAIFGLALVTYAFLSRKRFYCNALSGKSDYNICINSDMTVSCNCQDYDGSGHIGDLRAESLEKIFASSRAVHFRNRLAAGRLAISTCASCFELTLATRVEARYHALNWSVCTKGIMVENTVACPYRCTACYRGLVQKTRRSTHMTLEDIRKVADSLREYEIETLHFFNLGETFAAPDIGKQLQIIREDNPNLYIAISTNGVLLDTDEKRAAAMLADVIYFSIDGIDDQTMNKYQRGASFSTAYANMKKLVEYRRKSGKKTPGIEWKYVLFNWNDHQGMVLQAIELAKNAGVDAVSFCPTMSPLYGISWRYHLQPFYGALGIATWKGREIRFSD